MARGIGRPMAILVLSDEERSYLERQARRRRVARSLSDRCRMILRCADGLTNKAVAIGRVASITGQARSTLTRENGQPTDSNLAQPSSVILLRARTPICASVF